MKSELCRAFCNDIIVTKVPIGLAVSTAFKRDDGDRISFYVIEDKDGFHLEDDGATIPLLEGAGVDFESEMRRKALDSLLTTANAYYDNDNSTVKTYAFQEHELPDRALVFVGLMIRMGDFLLLTQERVASTFKEDAAAQIKESIGNRAKIRENEPVNAHLTEIRPDMVIEVNERPPVAIFFGNSASKVQDAMILHMTALYEIKQDLAVIALLEDENSVPSDIRRRAANRLTTVPVFRQDEAAAVSRITREALGRGAV